MKFVLPKLLITVSRKAVGLNLKHEVCLTLTTVSVNSVGFKHEVCGVSLSKSK